MKLGLDSAAPALCPLQRGAAAAAGGTCRAARCSHNTLSQPDLSLPCSLVHWAKKLQPDRTALHLFVRLEAADESDQPAAVTVRFASTSWAEPAVATLGPDPFMGPESGVYCALVELPRAAHPHYLITYQYYLGGELVIGIGGAYSRCVDEMLSRRVHPCTMSDFTTCLLHTQIRRRRGSVSQVHCLSGLACCKAHAGGHKR